MKQIIVIIILGLLPMLLLGQADSIYVQVKPSHPLYSYHKRGSAIRVFKYEFRTQALRDEYVQSGKFIRKPTSFYSLFMITGKPRIIYSIPQGGKHYTIEDISKHKMRLGVRTKIFFIECRKNGYRMYETYFEAEE